MKFCEDKEGMNDIMDYIIVISITVLCAITLYFFVRGV